MLPKSLRKAGTSSPPFPGNERGHWFYHNFNITRYCFRNLANVIHLKWPLTA